MERSDKQTLLIVSAGDLCINPIPLQHLPLPAFADITAFSTAHIDASSANVRYQRGTTYFISNPQHLAVCELSLCLRKSYKHLHITDDKQNAKHHGPSASA